MPVRILVVNRSTNLADQLRTACSDLAGGVDVVACERVGAAGDAVAQDGPFDIVMAGPSMGTRAGLDRMASLTEQAAGAVLLLAFSQRPEASLREIIRTGAVDLIQLPASDDALARSVHRASSIASSRQGAGQLAGRDDGSAILKPSEHGRVFTITSATGGCGKTFFSTNLAYVLAKWSGGRVCIIDLDLQFGEVATALRLRPKYTIHDALDRDDESEEDFRDQIEDYLVTHETGIHLLAAPRSPEEADRIEPPDVTRVIEAVRRRFDYVIVDTPTALTEVVLAALDLSDVLYVLGTLDLPSVRNMSVFLGTLDKLRIPSENVRLVLNKAEEDVGIELDQVRRLFPKEFESVLPYSREVSRSINLGMPIVASVPDSEVSVRLIDGVRTLLPPEQQAMIPEASGRGKSGLRRLLSRP